MGCMKNIRRTKKTANQYWIDIIYHESSSISNINVEPLVGPKYLWDSRLTQTLTIEGENSVTVWNDYYNNASLNLPFYDISKAPTYQLDECISSINFNGINNSLVGNGFSENSSNFTFIFVVGNLVDNLAEGNGQIFYMDAGGNWNAVYSGEMLNNIGFVVNLDQLGVFIAQPIQVFAIRVSGDGTQAEVWQNGGTPSVTPISINAGLQSLEIGSILGTDYLNGNVPWIAYYDSAISNIALGNALSYVGNAFGIPISPLA